MAIGIGIRVMEHGLTAMERKTYKYANRVKGAIEITLGRMAQDLRKDVVTGIKNQAPGGLRFKPLAESTKKRKGSSKALIDKGDLIRSINATKLGSMMHFVGIHRMMAARIAKAGMSLLNLAELHEKGSQKVKDRPPARPFLTPTFLVWKMEAPKRFAESVAKLIGVPMIGSARQRIGGVVGSVSFGD